jgi:sorbitol/mannitol transport system substrate-binding protein
MRTRSSAWRRALAAATVLPLLGVAACGGFGGTGGGGGNSGQSEGDVTLNVGVVANPDMQRMQELLPEFESSHPGIKVKFTTLDEITLRDKLQQDIATKSGQFDVAMVGVVEVPQWAKNDWIADIQDRATGSATYDVNDLLAPIKDGLSVDGKLYAVPFYGESSFMMYRTDLFEKAGITMPESPTWDQIQQFAAKVNDPENGVAGICLRGQAGWGSNLSAITTVLHTYGAHHYGPGYVPGLESPEAKAAAQMYVDLLTKYGQKGASSASFPECLNLFNQGKAAMWYDATVAASSITDPEHSKVADNVGFALAPKAKVETGGWLWAWSLSMIKTSKNQDAAWEFMQWATSKDYINLVAEKFAWNLVPPGTRQSTHNNPEYQKAAAAYAGLTLQAINMAKVNIDGAVDTERSFYVSIPEWTDVGTSVSQEFTAAIAGQKSVDQALTDANKVLADAAKAGGYS